MPFEIKEGTKILYNILDNQGKSTFDDEIVNELGKLKADVDVIKGVGPEAILNKIDENNYDLIIASVRHITGYGIGTSRFSGTIARNMMCGWQKQGVPVIFVTHTPNFKYDFEAVKDTVINTHGYARNCGKFVIEKIMGK